MATWNSDNIILTKLGEQVLSKVQSGVGKLTVSRIVSGAGHVSPSKLYNQSQITDIKQELTIVKYTTTVSQSAISANLTNTGLEEAYDLYQIGIYVTHPDFEGEVLYLIAQCDSPDHIPLPGDNPVTLSYDLIMTHSGTKEVVINVSEAGHIDVTTFNEFADKTNTALNGKVSTSDFTKHINNTTAHVTPTEKKTWNGKANKGDIPTKLPADGGNADTLDGLHADDFVKTSHESWAYQIAMPNDVDVPIWIANNAKLYTRYCTSGGNTGLTNNACGNINDYVWYYYDGLNIIATRNSTREVWIGCVVNGVFSGWNLINSSNADTLDGKHASDFYQLANGLRKSITHDDVIDIFSNISPNHVAWNSFTEVETNASQVALENAPETTSLSRYHVWTYGENMKRGHQIAVSLFSRKVYIRYLKDSAWSDWKNIADGGNADTLDGFDSTAFTKLNATVQLTTSINSQYDYGTFSCEAAYTPDFPAGYGSYGYLTVKRYGSICYQTMMFDSGVIIHRAIVMGATEWTNWQRLNDGGNAATVNGRHSGRISTQDANGNYFSENSTNINDAFIQWDGSTYFKLKTVGGNLTMVDNANTANTAGTPATTAGNVCLRNLSSGTSAANTTNCPSGAWYGQYEGV